MCVKHFGYVLKLQIEMIYMKDQLKQSETERKAQEQQLKELETERKALEQQMNVSLMFVHYSMCTL